jgi:hypothetical protein
MPRGKGDRDLYGREHALFCLGEGRPALWTSWDASLAGGGGAGARGEEVFRGTQPGRGKEKCPCGGRQPALASNQEAIRGKVLVVSGTAPAFLSITGNLGSVGFGDPGESTL